MFNIYMAVKDKSPFTYIKGHKTRAKKTPNSICNIEKKQPQGKVLVKSFHLNGYTLEFHPDSRDRTM